MLIVERVFSLAENRHKWWVGDDKPGKIGKSFLTKREAEKHLKQLKVKEVIWQQ